MASAYLEITLPIDEADRAKAADIYTQFKGPFLATIPGALSKELLVHTQDVQVLHGFDSTQSAQAYLLSDLFTRDVVVGLQPYLKGTPDIKVYQVA
ncbi:hypothetical protein [Spirosoma linguale]|uniref:ABM domain-containing protein n=1 Tax=Spirosoma linguale (strain ATCC 33905 / DSM 74 / LMG 10896 / Claus 1) TaxID=504472 RepID=D2QC38_SPILD|nr:conserved hypothetical protein [Spirosoma linguale DSM 74]